jgi:hypothetical protein
MPVAMALAGIGALVGSGAHVLGHLRFEHLLKHPLDDFPEQTCIVQQDILHHLRVRPTMIWGHRHSVSDRLP